MPRWSRETIITAIQGWSQQGLALNRLWQENPTLFAAGCRYFGCWPAAIRAAGLEVPPRRHWTRQIVLAEIRTRFKIHSSPTRMWVEDRFLASAAYRFFGNKAKALLAAGISNKQPKPIQRRRTEEIIAVIQSRHDQGLSVRNVWQEDIALYTSAKRRFGSWTNALRVAGLESNIVRHWTREDTIKAISARQRAGLPMIRVAAEAPALYAATRRFFGGWHKAMLAMGMKASPRRHWTRSLVVTAILARRKQGLPIPQTWKDDTSLFMAARRHFGNWQNALAAAGVKGEPRIHWSQDRIITALLEWHGSSSTNLRLVNRNLSVAVWRLFGSLEKALEVAGLEPKSRRWTSTRIIAAIQDGYIQGQSLATPGFRNLALAAAAKRCFGSWPAAIAAAGITVSMPPGSADH